MFLCCVTIQTVSIFAIVVVLVLVVVIVFDVVVVVVVVDTFCVAEKLSNVHTQRDSYICFIYPLCMD